MSSHRTENPKLRQGLKPLDTGVDPAPGDLPDADVDLSRPGASSAPGMPHERDETVGMTGGIPNDVVEQASADVERGLVDTSRAEATDPAYQRQKGDDDTATLRRP
jgi:hypothetical protein